MVAAPTVHLLDFRAFVRRAPLRMPFHFGAVEMTDLELIALRLDVAVEGTATPGHTESVLSPLWFDRDPARTPSEKREALLRAVHDAAVAHAAAGTGTPAQLHRDTAGEERPLVASFGVAMVDAAVVDAVCRATGMPLHAVLELPAPAERIAVRHTVGLADPLVASDLEGRLDDGLPETLEEAVREYGVRYFKLKVDADVERTAERLRRVAEVLAREAPDYRLTLDGNETLPDAESFARWAAALAADKALAEPWSRTLWIEQPLARAAALAEPLPPIDKPVIIDESDATDGALERAFALGYAGTSAKTCKGLFRTLHSFAAVQRRAGAILAGEDLTTVPMLGLHQDLAVAAAIGCAHLERNGHHYVRGLGFLSEREQSDALRHFPSLYRTLDDGTPALRIVDGMLATGEVNNLAFGAPFEPEWDAYEELELPG